MKPQLEGLKPYQPGKQIDEVKRELGLTEVVKLASNENPFGCSTAAVEAIHEAAQELAIYPDGYATTLRETVAKFLSVELNQLTFGNGTDEVISIISRSYLEPGSNTIMATPTFPQYKHNAILEGAEAREVPVVEGRHDLPAMLAQVDEKTRIIWLCNPNNPTGEYIPEAELVSFLSQVPKDVLVVLDEAYFEYVDAKDYPNSLNLLNEYSNLLITRTFSKIYGLAGLRVGYAVGAASVIKIMEAVREPFNTSRVAQKAASAALLDQEFIQSCHAKNREGLKQYYDFCEEKGLKYFPSQGNFILIDVNEPGDNVFQYLLKNGYIVRSGQALGYPTGVRITVGNKQQNEGVIRLLGEYFS